MYALCGLLFGYDIGMINGVQFNFSEYFDLDPAMKDWVIVSALLGSLLGVISAWKSWKSWKELSNKLDVKFIEKSINVIKKNIDNTKFSTENLALEIGMSRFELFLKLKLITGQSTSEFIRTIRLNKAAKLIESGKYSITEIIYMVGFSDPKYFRTCFKKHFGCTPSNYRILYLLYLSY